MSISNRLKELRLERGLSVKELAKEAGVSPPYIWQIEGGRRQNPGAEKLQKLATALRVTIAELIDSAQGIGPEALKDAPPQLTAFVRSRGKKVGVQKEDVEMLKRVHYRGKRPKSPEDYELVFLFLRKIME